ncbi:hypothetical protein ON010_g17975 [Phytophthora cinnamomi]|nr:hypothetical protein ON010_g17975 [Phytophthora cinnamomi]
MEPYPQPAPVGPVLLESHVEFEVDIVVQLRSRLRIDFLADVQLLVQRLGLIPKALEALQLCFACACQLTLETIELFNFQVSGQLLKVRYPTLPFRENVGKPRLNLRINPALFFVFVSIDPQESALVYGVAQRIQSGELGGGNAVGS